MPRTTALSNEPSQSHLDHNTNRGIVERTNCRTTEASTQSNARCGNRSTTNIAERGLARVPRDAHRDNNYKPLPSILTAGTRSENAEKESLAARATREATYLTPRAVLKFFPCITSRTRTTELDTKCLPQTTALSNGPSQSHLAQNTHRGIVERKTDPPTPQPVQTRDAGTDRQQTSRCGVFHTIRTPCAQMANRSNRKEHVENGFEITVIGCKSDPRPPI